MQKLTANDPESHSPNLIRENVERLKALFPELLTEGPNGISVNVDVLKQLVGDQTVTDADEKYGLSWHGKRRARQLALTPSTGTLRPCPEDSEDWETTQNLFIEGDNLEVLKLLQKSYAGKVKLIYIDPPYNTGNDFVYPDAFQDSIKNYLELTGQVEGGRKMTTHTDSSGRFHTEWLNMMYPRLKLAQSLLTKDGAIFVSCDEAEQARLRLAMDEIFGGENFVADMVWAAGRKNDSRLISVSHEYIVCYSRNSGYLTENKTEWRQRKKGLEDIYEQYKKIKKECGANYSKMTEMLREWYKNLSDSHPSKSHKHYNNIDSRGIYFAADISWPGGGGPKYKVIHPKTGKPVKVPTGGWRFSTPESMQTQIDDERIHFGENEQSVPCRKSYLKEHENQTPYSVFYQDGRAATKRLRDLMGSDCFSFPKDETILQEIVEMLTSEGDIIMDFFAGSGTTGHAVMAQNAADGGNRRYILVQLPEPLNPEKEEQAAAAAFCDALGKPRTIAELTKERLRRAGQQIARDVAKGSQGTEAAPLFAEPAAEAPGLDVGFRVFKLDSTNLREWDPQPESLETSLFESIDPIKPGRAEADVLYEVLLKWGLDLCVPIETRTITQKTVHAVGGGVLMACLAESISREEAEALALGIAEWRTALDPAGETLCLFRDSAFEDDVAKTNLTALLAQQKITQVRSL